MARELPRWLNEGVEPPEELKTLGYRKGNKLPFQYHNYFMNRTYLALEELQLTKLDADQLIDFRDELLNQISNRVLVFDNVSAMRANNSFKVGDVVETLGYYTINDGGAARYTIVNTSQNPDGYFELQTAKGLVARLIPDATNTVNFKQLGARPQSENTKYDCKPYLEAYISRLDNIPDRAQRLKLYIPAGIWNFRPTTLYNHHGWSITGDVAFTHRNISNQGTIINAMENNQETVWTVGREDALQFNFELGNLTFSACNYIKGGNLHYVTDSYAVNRAALYMCGSCNGTIHPLNFQEVTGTAFEITSSWELRFSSMTYRYIADFTKPVMNFAATLPALASEQPNISNVHFGLLDFEVVSGDIMNFEVDSWFVNSSIETLVVESSTYMGGTNIELSDPAYNDATSTKFSILRINGEFTGNRIGSILINNFAYMACIDNGIQYLYDTIIGTYADLYKLTLEVPIITVQQSRKDYNIIRNFNGSPNSLSTFTIGEVQNQTDQFKGIYNVTQFPTIIKRDDYGLDFGGSRLLTGDFIPAKDTVRRVTGPSSRPGMLHYDNTATSPDKLVVRPITWIDRANGEMMYLANRQGQTLNARIKIPNTATLTPWIHKKGDQALYREKVLTGDGTYKNYELLAAADNVFATGDIIAINLIPQFFVDFDFFFWS